jgi:regulator of protease activity HflC (stomatin/prohibitin superfamily)
MDEKFIKKIVIGLLALVFLVVLPLACCSVVRQRERGIQYTFGQVRGEVIQPGIKLHAPFITTIKKYSIVPKPFQTKFTYGSDAAVTKDLQSVGCDLTVIYKYNEDGIMKVAMYYGDSIIEDNIKRLLTSSTKSIIGKYSIYDLTANQMAISEEVKGEIRNQIAKSEYPITIDNVIIANWDWSPEFDKKIQDRMNATESALKAEQDLKLAETNAQKIVKEAEAKKKAAEQDAEALKIRAQADAEAKKIAADATEYELKKIAQNISIQREQWKYEVDLKRAERWNGVEISNQSIYVPNTYDLRTGK